MYIIRTRTFRLFLKYISPGITFFSLEAYDAGISHVEDSQIYYDSLWASVCVCSGSVFREICVSMEAGRNILCMTVFGMNTIYA